MLKVKPEDLISVPTPLVDVRSPGEFGAGHIPGAHSLPLFSNEERAEVGISYKNDGPQAAIKLGLDIVGPKMRNLVEQAEELGAPALTLYCWRGGMRSESMAWLLEKGGLEIGVLEGGYKAFRRQVHGYFDQPLPLHVLTGYTGSTKTEVLHAMADQGVQVIDLEGLANHQGSSFGNQLSTYQPSTEQFQNDLLTAFLRMDATQPIWLEDESICIGKVSLPESLFEQMSLAPHYHLTMPQSRRIRHLVSAYGKLEADQLITATLAIRKKLGPGPTEEAIEHLSTGQMDAAAQIILSYYDRQYRKSIDRKKELIQVYVDGAKKDINQIAKELIEKQCQLN
ncbi:MAG: tRNA 2-selenouridine(34) synthase MnmH [Bacteroidota bacterium]